MKIPTTWCKRNPSMENKKMRRELKKCSRRNEKSEPHNENAHSIIKNVKSKSYGKCTSCGGISLISYNEKIS